MKHKRNVSGQSILEGLRQQHDVISSNSDDGLDHISLNQDGNEYSFMDASNQNNNEYSQSASAKRHDNDPLLVNVKDISTGEIITRKMTAIQIWSLKKSEKVMMELDANGQGKDNSSNLFVRFLGQVARRVTFCPISIKRWDDMPEDNTKRQ
ncbi:hypothetical protein PIB30_080168 [Stylosanthes scabra]|uniref:Uncharacterized protein n=1 Tax=Stylosanthes scabra TaxID=79078 RepID=A0ABU6UQT3_9FABA|nr:hypothetical protein [Stylosanthes scabra]